MNDEAEAKTQILLIAHEIAGLFLMMCQEKKIEPYRFIAGITYFIENMLEEREEDFRKYIEFTIERYERIFKKEF